MRLRLLVLSLSFGIASMSFGAVTYHRDVVPILQKHCQSCHRPGEIGPMPLLTFQQVRPWAKAIRQTVVQKNMPPWHADPKHGQFLNDRSLSSKEVETLSEWADRGAVEGKASDSPKPRTFSDGWAMGEPDMVFEMPKEFEVPATGVVDYKWIKIKTGFTEDKWVEACEIRPGNRSVVHHSVVYAREPEIPYAKDEPYDVFFELKRESFRGLPRTNKNFSAEYEPEHLQVYAPGSNPVVLRPGQARLIRAGADIIFEMHYTPNGKPATDRTRIGLIFAKNPPTERVRSVRINNGTELSIPPGDPNYSKESRIEVMHPLKLVAFMPHMHLRGKAMDFKVTYPNGETEVLLSVPRYQFQWQMTYYLKEPKLLPKGSILMCTAVFDNSPNNKFNPDPTATVKSGRQSWEEMMAGFFDVGIEPDVPVIGLFRDAKPVTAPSSVAGGQ